MFKMTHQTTQVSIQDDYSYGQKTKSASSKSDARRQAESMESYQRNFFVNNQNSTLENKNTTTYQVTQSDRPRAQNSAAKMMEEYRHTVKPTQGTYPSTFQ